MRKLVLILLFIHLLSLVGISGNQDRTVKFRLHVRLQDKVFRTQDIITTSNVSGPVIVDFDPPVIIPPGSDIHIDAISSGTSTECSSTLTGYLAKKP